MKYNLNFGADPEVFATYLVKDKEFAYSPAALERFEELHRIGGTDKHPVFFEDTDYKIIMDGAAFELNFKKPFQNLKEFYFAIKSAVARLEDGIGVFGYGISQKPTVMFDYNRFWTKELEKDETFMQGIIFGCDPDMDAFKVNWLASVLDVSKHPFRYGGGHIHISGDKDIEKFPIPFVKLLALTVGNYCIYNSPFPQEEILRAMYYGKPGKYRIQEYKECTGLEYRTPSNAWMNYSYDLFEGIFNQVEIALDLLKNPPKGKELLETFSDKTVQAITTADKSLAKEILSNLQ
jgi:hypothetical protein